MSNPTRRNRDLDPVHIEQAEHDHEAEAKRVMIVSTEMAIELSADDGDSVISKHESKIVSGEEPADCRGMKTVCLFGICDSVMISPADSGENWHLLSLTALVPKEICARRIKMVTPVENACLVMQSV
jgi:hypothetical protein